MKIINMLNYQTLLKIQGIYYIITGIWPILSMDTFLMVTGPKTDLWLVIVVGMLIFLNGLVFLYCSYAKERNIPVEFLAAGMALTLAVLEVIFFIQGIISAVYLLDAALELVLVIFWMIILIPHLRKSI
jgi:hypothetical protein